MTCSKCLIPSFGSVFGPPEKNHCRRFSSFPRPEEKKAMTRAKRKRTSRTGGLQQFGPGKFRIRYRVKGKRHTQMFDGTKEEAEAKIRDLLGSADKGQFVEQSRMMVADFVRARVDHWEASGEITARTADRYRELVENQIAPHLGTKFLQKLRPLDIEDWHTTLRNSGRADNKGGLAPRTIGHAHRVLGRRSAMPFGTKSSPRTSLQHSRRQRLAT